nr:hypothetical protein [Chthoniobacterales bacterium]
AANQDAIAAAMGKTMLDILNGEPGEANAFIHNVPVRVIELTILDEHVTSTVVPLTSKERAALLQRVRTSSAVTTAPSR